MSINERDQRKLDNAVKNIKRKLKSVAEGDKIAFSIQDDLVEKNTDIDEQDPIHFSGDTTINITRDEFEALIRPFIEKTIEKFKNVIVRAGYREKQQGREFKLDKVVLAGKSSRIPIIRNMLLNDPELGLVPESFDESLRDDEKNCVARGAAYYGHFRGREESEIEIEARVGVLTQSIGLIRIGGGGRQPLFEAIPGLKKGAVFSKGELKGQYDRPWKREGKEEIAQNAGPDNKVLRNPDITRIGIYRWGGLKPETESDDIIHIHISVDANGLISVNGKFGELPFGNYQPIPPAFAERQVFVFI